MSALGGGQGAKTGLYAFGIDKSQDHPKKIDIANCITGNENRGVAKVRSQGTAIAIPVLTPDQDRHGVGQDTKDINAVWSDKYQSYITIRKLTPRECFRLQGWTDEYFEKAKQFNSDSQLYKQAGNGVTVDVVKAIGEKLKEQEND